jgi:copper(I)-binding protein
MKVTFSLLMVIALTGCGGQPSSSTGLTVTGVWARTSPAMATAGAIYMNIANGGASDDALLSASVDTSVAATVQIHETVPVGSAMGSAPMMEMRPVDRISIPAGQSVALAPGGYHVMLLDLAAPLELGRQIAVTLTFERAGAMTVTATVRETAP